MLGYALQKRWAPLTNCREPFDTAKSVWNHRVTGWKLSAAFFRRSLEPLRANWHGHKRYRALPIYARHIFKAASSTAVEWFLERQSCGITVDFFLHREKLCILAGEPPVLIPHNHTLLSCFDCAAHSSYCVPG